MKINECSICRREVGIDTWGEPFVYGEAYTEYCFQKFKKITPEEIQEEIGSIQANKWYNLYKKAEIDYYNTEIAETTSDPTILRKILERGNNDEVSWYAAKNHNCTPEILKMVLERGNNDGVSQNAAWHPNCPPEILKMVLERGNDDEVSHNAALNHNCTPEILKMVLERGNDDLVSGYAIQNPNCPPEILKMVLERGNDDLVSTSAAKNPSCTPEILKMVLERGKDDGVSQNAAWHPNCPPEILKMVLERGNNNEVSWNAARNPSCTPEILKMVLERGNNDVVSQNAALNPNCTPEILKMVIERGNDDLVSGYAAKNPNCPPEILKMVIEREKDDLVSWYAMQNPSCPPEARTKYYFNTKIKQVTKKLEEKGHIISINEWETQVDEKGNVLFAINECSVCGLEVKMNKSGIVDKEILISSCLPFKKLTPEEIQEEIGSIQANKWYDLYKKAEVEIPKNTIYVNEDDYKSNFWGENYLITFYNWKSFIVNQSCLQDATDDLIDYIKKNYPSKIFIDEDNDSQPPEGYIHGGNNNHYLIYTYDEMTTTKIQPYKGDKYNSSGLKLEMKNYLKSVYKHFSNGEWGEDEAEIAIYYFANDYHGGQDSELYSILSTSPFKPGTLNTDNLKKMSILGEDETAQEMYKSLEDKFGSKVTGNPNFEKDLIIKRQEEQSELLKQDAEEACLARKHTLQEWKDDISSTRIISTNECSVCGLEVQINTKPLPNEIDIGGDALAENCFPKFEQMSQEKIEKEIGGYYAK